MWYHKDTTNQTKENDMLDYQQSAKNQGA